MAAARELLNRQAMAAYDAASRDSHARDPTAPWSEPRIAVWDEHEVRACHSVPCSRCGCSFNDEAVYYLNGWQPLGERIGLGQDKICAGCLGAELRVRVGTDMDAIHNALRALRAEQRFTWVDPLRGVPFVAADDGRCEHWSAKRDRDREREEAARFAACAAAHAARSVVGTSNVHPIGSVPQAVASDSCCVDDDDMTVVNGWIATAAVTWRGERMSSYAPATCRPRLAAAAAARQAKKQRAAAARAAAVADARAATFGGETCENAVYTPEVEVAHALADARAATRPSNVGSERHVRGTRALNAARVFDGRQVWR